jgi:hypothetical protein
MNEIELMAWNREPLPKKATAEKIIVYCIARTLYEQYSAGQLTKEEAQGYKLTALTYYETIKELARSNSKIIVELAKATAPRAEMTRKSNAELLDVIFRIEGVVTGLMKRYDDPIPKILKVEEVKE